MTLRTPRTPFSHEVLVPLLPTTQFHDQRRHAKSACVCGNRAGGSCATVEDLAAECLCELFVAPGVDVVDRREVAAGMDVYEAVAAGQQFRADHVSQLLAQASRRRCPETRG